MKTLALKFFIFSLGALLVGFALSSVAPVSAAPEATFNVNSTADKPDANPGDGVCAAPGRFGKCTLRAAIMEANANANQDTINLPAGIYKLTRVGVDNTAFKGDLDIKYKLQIVGAPNYTSIIDGNGTVTHERVITILPFSKVTIEGVQVINGQANGDGGGIYNGGNLTLDACIVESNTAKRGGGIFNAATKYAVGELTIGGSKLHQNTADRGGGIFNRGNLTLEQSHILSNYVQKDINSSGGGIANTGEMTMTGTNLDANYSKGNGGGIDNEGSATIQLSLIQHNTAARMGGGIINGYTHAAALVLTKSTLDKNHAIYNGSGISNFRDLTIAQSTFKENGGGNYGGAISSIGNVVMTNSTLSGNKAFHDGGGINVQGGLVRLFSVTITKNIADSDGDGAGTGGGVFVWSDLEAALKFTNTIIAENYNYDASDGALWGDECGGTLTSQGYNLLWTIPATCTIAGNTTGNKTGTDPKLLDLNDYGGPTETHYPGPGSPIVDMGNPTGCRGAKGVLLGVDQRDLPRSVDGDGRGGARCDIGAVEK